MMKCLNTDIPTVQNFSAKYAVVDSTVREWDRDIAVMDADLYDYLSQLFQSPVTGLIQGRHYVFKRSLDVLSGEVAVPMGESSSNPSVLLILK